MTKTDKKITYDKKQVEEDARKFSSYLDSLTVKEYKAMFEKIAQACCISKRRLYYWRTGKVSIRPIYKKTIIEVIGRDIFA